MKIGGKEIKSDYFEVIPVIRGEEEIIFKAQPVGDYVEFDKLVKAPVPPKGLKPDNVTFNDIENPAYIKQEEKYLQQRTDWMKLKSLEPSDIVWDTVNMSDPETFGNWENDLRKLKFTNYQIMAIVNGIFKAQGLDSDKIEEAKKRFLASAQ